MKVKGEELEVVTRKAYKLLGVKCEVCERLIEPPSKEDRYKWSEDQFKYYEVTTGHNDWGNDSADSVEHYDICPDCITGFVDRYLKHEASNRSGYIEVEVNHIFYDEKMYE